VQAILERLAGAGIGLVPTVEIRTHYIFERGGFVALVERKPDGFGGIGAPGLMDGPAGYAALVWRGDVPWFVARGFERRATAGQVTALRQFAADLRIALTGK
jgi:hypothetical protein